MMSTSAPADVTTRTQDTMRECCAENDHEFTVTCDKMSNVGVMLLETIVTLTLRSMNG